MLARRMLLGTLFVATAAAVGVAGEFDASAAERGARLFEVYCANCHGGGGKGDGPTASYLAVRPADLTTISAANRGEFPVERVYRQIDGRDPLPGHGQREMPIWGLGFQEPGLDVDQQAAVRTKISALIEHLKSIQSD